MTQKTVIWLSRSLNSGSKHSRKDDTFIQKKKKHGMLDALHSKVAALLTYCTVVESRHGYQVLMLDENRQHWTRSYKYLKLTYFENT